MAGRPYLVREKLYPSFCELQSKNGLVTWAASDEGNLMANVEEERQTMDDIHEHLLYNNHPISHWCYGHFHQSWHVQNMINVLLYVYTALFFCLNISKLFALLAAAQQLVRSK